MTSTEGATHHDCPDCGSTLLAITLFGRGERQQPGGTPTDAPLLYYAAASPKRNGWLGMLTEVGGVASYKCTGCERIFMYSRP